MEDTKKVNILVGVVMGVISYFVDVHVPMTLLALLVGAYISSDGFDNLSFSYMEENGFYYFLAAFFISWAILYNIRMYTVRPILKAAPS